MDARDFMPRGGRGDDLATVLGLSHGRFDAHAPLFQAMDSDPVLKSVKWIAEPWDIRQHETGRFPDNWMEWNDRYRDTVRLFWRAAALP